MHGEEEATKAQEASRALFAGGANLSDIPTTELMAEDMVDGGIDLITLLVKAGLVNTKSEGRRALEQGGVAVDNQKITDMKATIRAEQLSGDGVVVRRGKKNYRRVVYRR